MKKNSFLPKAIVFSIGLIAGSAWADVVPTMYSVDGVDSLAFIDERDGGAKGNLTSVPLAGRQFLETKLAAGSAKPEDFSTAPYAPFVDGQTGDLVVDPLTGPIGAFGIPGAISLGIGSHYVQTARTDGGAGRFDPTSTDDCTGAAADCTARWFEASGEFTINFGTGYGAFGFYGTDFGDFAGRLTMYLLRDGAAEIEIIFDDFSDSDTGALGFFGFYDTVNRYTGVRFVVAPGEQDDYFGFDDLILGQVAGGGTNPVPEPGSLALVGASLLALTAARRRRAGSNKA